MNRNAAVRVGVITLAVSLIVLGGAWLAQNLTSYPVMSQLTRWWPVLLILLGLEYLWRHYRYGPEMPVRWSIGSLLLVFLICGGLATAAWVPSTPFGHMRDLINSLEPHSFDQSFDIGPIGGFPGKKVRVENGMGRVRVMPSPDEQLHIRGSISYRGLEARDNFNPPDEPSEIATTRGDTLVIRVDSSQTGYGVANVNYEIELPPGLDLEVENGNGGVVIAGLNGDLSVTNRLGEVEVKDCQGKVAVRNDSGNLRLENIQGNTALQSRLGMIAVKNIKGSLLAETSSGQINIRTERPVEENWDLKTSLGSIDIQIPRSSSVVLEAEAGLGSVGGSREIGWETEGGKKVFRLGEGKGTVRMRADRGSIRVELED